MEVYICVPVKLTWSVCAPPTHGAQLAAPTPGSPRRNSGPAAPGVSAVSQSWGLSLCACSSFVHGRQLSGVYCPATRPPPPLICASGLGCRCLKAIPASRAWWAVSGPVNRKSPVGSLPTCPLSAGYTGPPCSRHPPVSDPTILFVMSVSMKEAGTVGWNLSTSRVYLWVDFWLLEAQLIVSPSLSPVSPRRLHPRSCPKCVWDPTSRIWMYFALPGLGHTPMFAVNSVKVVSCWDRWYSSCFQLQVCLLLQLTCQPGNPLGFPSPSHGLLGLMVNLAVIVLSGIFGAVVWI